MFTISSYAVFEMCFYSCHVHGLLLKAYSVSTRSVLLFIKLLQPNCFLIHVLCAVCTLLAHRLFDLFSFSHVVKHGCRSKMSSMCPQLLTLSGVLCVTRENSNKSNATENCQIFLWVEKRICLANAYFELRRNYCII